MLGADSDAFRQALDDFALVSGYLIVAIVDRSGIVRDINKGFEIGVRPAGDPRGQPLASFLTTASEQPLDVLPGLPGGAPLPYCLRTWDGKDLLVNAYPLADELVLLIGAVTSPDESQTVQRMSRLTTEMGNLVRSLRRANQRIQCLADQDGLTQLANRRYFMERLGVELAHALRHGRPVCLLMLDLDHFKRINDRFGHAGGDTVLRGFAELLRARARASDLAARLGGEEFVLMLRDANPEDALEAAERIRCDAASLRLLGRENLLTVSIGVAVQQIGDEPDAILMRADEALYAAKHAGRNQVMKMGVTGQQDIDHRLAYPHPMR
ncbi:MAG: GGDEF domain-containing protein [Lamprobacter sp.]|uniref:GGDEF domain-containing protein n=1 Tax=Lamprobacter sp. TaxID=3100796 RepID=UPI002B263AB3|nr:GGDEF domain-containing protein [Lamprobacter sp.]MEA3640495.1 GGDEF domain-containing protein [Lamprobacter sp.]